MAEKKRLQIDIDPDLFNRLKQEAETRGLKFWAYVQQVLKTGMAKVAK